MLKLLGVYVVVTVTMLVLDLVWLRGIATSWYEEGLRHLMAPKPDLKGALFGFFAYATYDLSNLATLRDWPLNVSLMDMAWGTLASGLSVGAGKLCLDALRR
jgi:uncharacterized membrane protein